MTLTLVIRTVVGHLVDQYDTIGMRCFDTPVAGVTCSRHNGHPGPHRMIKADASQVTHNLFWGPEVT